MRIQSSFKDYYDYVAFEYGGGDPRVTYVRKPLDTVPNQKKEFINKELNCRLAQESYFVEFGLTSILFCGRCFHVVQSKKDYEEGKNNWELLTHEFLEKQREGLYKVERKGANYRYIDIKPTHWRYRSFYDSYARKVDEQLRPLHEQPVLPWVLRIHRAFEVPVLQWDDGRGTTPPMRDIPMLSKLGFPKYFPAAQVYQELALFVGNTLNTNPDITPPAKVSDKDRILQHGFDLKRSFRH
jgi:hypothetical protein